MVAGPYEPSAPPPPPFNQTSEMTTILYNEANTQFLARMLLATREGHQIASKDAQRLGDLAQFGPHGQPTMPEERRDASKPLQPISGQDALVT